MNNENNKLTANLLGSEILSIHEKINIRSWFKHEGRAIEPYLITLFQIDVWKHNKSPYIDPNGKYNC